MLGSYFHMPCYVYCMLKIWFCCYYFFSVADLWIPISYSPGLKLEWVWLLKHTSRKRHLRYRVILYMYEDQYYISNCDHYTIRIHMHVCMRLAVPSVNHFNKDTYGYVLIHHASIVSIMYALYVFLYFHMSRYDVVYSIIWLIIII